MSQVRGAKELPREGGTSKEGIIRGKPWWAKGGSQGRVCQGNIFLGGPKGGYGKKCQKV